MDTQGWIAIALSLIILGLGLAPLGIYLAARMNFGLTFVPVNYGKIVVTGGTETVDATPEEGGLKRIVVESPTDVVLDSVELVEAFNSVEALRRPKIGMDGKAELELWDIVKKPPKGKYPAIDKLLDERENPFLKEWKIHVIGSPLIDRIWTFTYERATFDMKQAGETVRFVVSHRSQHDLNMVNLRDYTSYIEMEPQETKENIPLIPKIALITLMRNPYKAFFRGQHWPKEIAVLIIIYVRLLIGNKTVEEVNNESTTDTLDKFIKGHVGEIIRDRYGIELVRVGFWNVDPPDDLRAATTQKYKDEQVAAGRKALAKADAAEVIEVTNAVKEGGPAGELAAKLRAIEKSSNNPGTVILVPSDVTDIFKKGKP